MFFDQINAPATLRIYVLMHLVNSKFLGRLYRALRARLFFFYAIQQSLSFEEERHSGREASNIVKPHSHHKAYCYMMYMCVTACFILEFSCCVSCSPSLYAGL